MRCQLRPIVALACCAASASIAAQAKPEDNVWRLEVQLKAQSLIVDPATGERAAVLDPMPDPLGIISPDGKSAAYVASDPARVKAGHESDLFVADVDANQPSSKANVRRLSTDQQHPSNAQWLPSSSGIVFQAGENPTQQVWYVDLAPDSTPVRLSDGQLRAYDASILPDGRVAWIVHKGSKNKAQFKDLVLRSSPAVSGKLRTLLSDEHISSYAFSPDGRTLAWSGLGSLFLVNVESGESREIPLHAIHKQLINHTVHDCAWRPDGRIIAIRCGFLGGIARAFNADPNAPWPRMFAQDKVFFIPVGWTPTPESLTVGEGDAYPSPTADDPQAEISPPTGDESKPWWVREVPERAHGLGWITAAEAKRRVADHPAPPEVQAEVPR